MIPRTPLQSLQRASSLRPPTPTPTSAPRRGLSVCAAPRARIVHPDTDTLVRYSLLHGPPRTPRAKIYKTAATKSLAARPPTTGAAALEHRVLDEVARHVVAAAGCHHHHHHHGPCRRAARYGCSPAGPADDAAVQAADRDPHKDNSMEARGPASEPVGGGHGHGPMGGQSGSEEHETPGSMTKTAAHYRALLAVASAGALAGYLIRSWETSTRPGESAGAGRTGGRGTDRGGGPQDDEVQKLQYLAAA